MTIPTYLFTRKVMFPITFLHMICQETSFFFPVLFPEYYITKKIDFVLIGYGIGVILTKRRKKLDTVSMYSILIF